MGVQQTRYLPGTFGPSVDEIIVGPSGAISR
jgi:hypothetical protein